MKGLEHSSFYMLSLDATIFGLRKSPPKIPKTEATLKKNLSRVIHEGCSSE